jgi:hypothetical protein|tara:strand:+ start:1903 stop:2280 length:378 start_codon:yes stop_codon:yes gene_type:complete
MKNKIKKIVKEQILEENFLPEKKIDGIIKEYLSERNDFLDNEESLQDEYEFSPKTTEALLDMTDGLSEMIDDLDIIKEKEGNVLIYQNEYSDEYLEDIIQDLERVVGRINGLTELSDNLDLDVED